MRTPSSGNLPDYCPTSAATIGCQVRQKCSCWKVKKGCGRCGPGTNACGASKKLYGNQAGTGRGRFGSLVLTKLAQYVCIWPANSCSPELSGSPKLNRNCNSAECSDAVGKPNTSLGALIGTLPRGGA